MFKSIHVLCLAAGLALICSSALADIGPPVTVKLSS